MPVTTPVSLREQKLLIILGNIVEEAMEFPKLKPYSGDSSLPAHMISQAQDALADYGYETGGTLPAVEQQSEPAAAPVCVQCAYINRRGWEQPYCNHPRATCPVNGTRHRLCHDERESASPHAYCGVAGKGFRKPQKEAAHTKPLPTCTNCRHAKKVASSPTDEATELFCSNPKIGWRAGVGSGVKCVIERSFHSTLAGCGTPGRLFEAISPVEVAA